MTTGPTRPAEAGQTVQSLLRGLAVIRSFSGEQPELSLSEVARVTGMSRAAARRFLLTLIEVGYVRTDGRQFALTPRILELGYAYLSGAGLPEIATPHLRTLVAQVDESASLAVLDQAEIVYLARVPVRRIMSVSIGVGTRFPAVITSMGRVLLAAEPPDRLEQVLAGPVPSVTPFTVTDPVRIRVELADIAVQGWALVDQELEVGLRSIAVPVLDGTGRVVAAINVSVPAGSGSVTDTRRRLLEPLRNTAARIESDLALARR